MLKGKTRCPNPNPEENVEIVEKKRFKLQMESKTYGDMQRDGFYNGDEIEYKCKTGQVFIYLLI